LAGGVFKPPAQVPKSFRFDWPSLPNAADNKIGKTFIVGSTVQRLTARLVDEEIG
jgi:hypothetical protein